MKTKSTYPRRSIAVRVNGKKYDSVQSAFTDNRIPLNTLRSVRNELRKNGGKHVHKVGRREFAFRLLNA